MNSWCDVNELNTSPLSTREKSLRILHTKDKQTLLTILIIGLPLHTVKWFLYWKTRREIRSYEIILVYNISGGDDSIPFPVFCLQNNTRSLSTNDTSSLCIPTNSEQSMFTRVNMHYVYRISQVTVMIVQVSYLNISEYE